MDKKKKEEAAELSEQLAAEKRTSKKLHIAKALIRLTKKSSERYFCLDTKLFLEELLAGNEETKDRHLRKAEKLYKRFKEQFQDSSAFLECFGEPKTNRKGKNDLFPKESARLEPDFDYAPYSKQDAHKKERKKKKSRNSRS